LRSGNAIEARRLGKRFRLGRATARYQTLRDTIVEAFTLRKSIAGGHLEASEFWALRDVDLEVKDGEVMGIVGPNGAGKSTLLKVLSRITEPTEGEVDIRGRVGSLLEVGAGFHPELTGRENIFLYGAILGMRKSEILRKFDEIVAFAEVERFLDTPVKRYSSGMYVRLAFAVAAHLEPDILLVDEVLSVGDIQFQRKCLGKMENVASSGRTVLFVSHNLLAVEQLCDRAMWLDSGRCVDIGATGKIVRDYVTASLESVTEVSWEDRSEAPGNDMVWLSRVAVTRTDADSESASITVDTPFAVEVDFWNRMPSARLHVTLHFENAYGVFVLETGSLMAEGKAVREYSPGHWRARCEIPDNLLNNGGYTLRILIVKDEGNVILRHDRAVFFDIMDVPSGRTAWFGQIQGVMRPKLGWTVSAIDQSRDEARISDKTGS